MYLDSSDLELVFDLSEQTVGLRFTELNIPEGATVVDARLQFTVDEINTTAIRVYPNPTTGLLIIQADLDGMTPYQLRDLSGRLILEGNLDGSRLCSGNATSG